MREIPRNPVSTSRDSAGRTNRFHHDATEKNEGTKSFSSTNNETEGPISRTSREQVPEPEGQKAKIGQSTSQTPSQQAARAPATQSSVYQTALSRPSAHHTTSHPRTAASLRPPPSEPQYPPARSSQRQSSREDPIEGLIKSEQALRQKCIEVSGRLKRINEQNTELEGLLKKTKLQLADACQDLGASRAFRSTEDSGDGTLVKALEGINKGADEMVYAFTQGLPGGVRLSYDDLHALCQFDNSVSHLADQALRAKISARDFLNHTAVFWFHSIMHQYIFRPFIPGMEVGDNTLDDHFSHLYSSICRNEPQDRSARWRAITYLNGYPNRDDKQLIEDVALSFEKIVVKAVPYIFSGRAPDIHPIELGRHARKLAADAIEWRNKAMYAHLSSDLRPIMYSGGERYNSTCMKPKEQPMRGEVKEGSKILIGTGSGLIAVRHVPKEGKGFEEEARVVLKAWIVSELPSRGYTTKFWGR